MVSSKRTSARSVSTLIAPLILSRGRPVFLEERLLNFGYRVPARFQFGSFFCTPAGPGARSSRSGCVAHAPTMLDGSGDGLRRGIERTASERRPPSVARHQATLRCTRSSCAATTPERRLPCSACESFRTVSGSINKASATSVAGRPGSIRIRDISFGTPRERLAWPDGLRAGRRSP